MSRAAAVVLALVFTWSATAKVAARPDMTALGLPAWTGGAIVVAEAALVVMLLVSPVVGGIAALALLAGFTAFLVRRLGTGTGCGCFGSSSTRPVSRRDLVRNTILLLLAGVAAFG